MLWKIDVLMVWTELPPQRSFGLMASSKNYPIPELYTAHIIVLDSCIFFFFGKFYSVGIWLPFGQRAVRWDRSDLMSLMSSVVLALFAAHSNPSRFLCDAT